MNTLKLQLILDPFSHCESLGSLLTWINPTPFTLGLWYYPWISFLGCVGQEPEIKLAQSFWGLLHTAGHSPPLRAAAYYSIVVEKILTLPAVTLGADTSRLPLLWFAANTKPGFLSCRELQLTQTPPANRSGESSFIFTSEMEKAILLVFLSQCQINV